MTDPNHNLVWHDHAITRAERERLNGHASCVIWFTGLSGSGKSTIANLVEQNLFHAGVRSYLLDGDNVRHGLNATPGMLAQNGEAYAKRFGLGFAAEDRQENIRRVGAVSKLFCDAGVLTLTAFVSPYRADRDAVRAILDKGDFIEVFVDTPLEVCEARDPKGLYKKARAGELSNFTGVNDPYEPPVEPELTLMGGELPAEDLADQVVAYLRSVGKLRS